jgi:hypothetical protein
MKIKLEDIKYVINKTFKDIDLLYFEEVFEKSKRGYKYIIFLHNYFYEEKYNIYTKLIFYVDDDKKYVIKKHFKYLYNINCVFRVINFDNVIDMEEKIINILKNNDFGEDLMTLSSFMISPTTKINEWFFKKGIVDVSVNHIKYTPKTISIGCEYLSFDFDIDVDNINMDMNIKKEDDEFIISFILYDEVETVYVNKLDDLINIIGDFIYNNFKK